MSTGSLNMPVSAGLDITGRVRKELEVAGRIAGVSGTEGLITYVLLGLMALVVAWSVQLADWGDSPVLIWTVLIGTAVGVAFVRPVGPWPLKHLFGILIGLPISIWQVSSSADGANVFARFGDVWTRLDIWIDIARADGISTDPLPFSVFLSVIAWLVAYFAGWSLFKFRTPWAPSFIFGLAILTNLSYRFGQFEYTFYFFAAIAIALFAHVTLVNTRRRWDAQGIQHSHGLNADAILAPIAIGAIVVVIAGFMPMYKIRPDTLDRAWGAMKDPFRDRLSDDALRLFPNVGGIGSGDLRAFDQVLAFKGRIKFKEEPLFFIGTRYETLNPARTYSVYTSQGWLAGPVAEFNRQPADSLPLEGTLLERISVEQRIVSDDGKLGFAVPGDYALNIDRPYISEELPPIRVQLNMVEGDLGSNLPADILSYADELRKIYLEPEIFDRAPVEDVIGNLLPPDLEIIDFGEDRDVLESITIQRVTEPIFDQVAARFTDRTEPGEPVVVQRLISQATGEQLDAAGTEYPLWVTDRYLQLPDSVPGEVAELANQIVSDADAITPYEITEALTAHLRGFGYSQDIEGPGPEVDGVSYFLFDTANEPCSGASIGSGCDDDRPKGYSQYFGSALAVMLRTQGVPARMVSGFKAGTFDPVRAGFVIKDVDSHGWAQAFFPDYGWIDLESTPGVPQPLRGTLPELEVTFSGTTDSFAAGDNPFTETGEFPQGEGDGPDLDDLLSATRSESSTPLWPFVVGVAGVLGLVVSILAWRWRFWAMSPTGRAYAGMSRLGWLSGTGRRRYETPGEYALRLGETARDADEGAQDIARAFELETYSGREIPEAIHEAVREEWPSVRWALIRRALLRLIGVKPKPPLRIALANPIERPLYSRIAPVEADSATE
ncbi:MAG: transglutaminase domain-containing protein [Chloroflexi bacterium]|mgnify:CR=1 FL=1|jgi:transglutaminase-like putative cysteine protease|nr:transglutaminase domain-containing protein [Chloroflexota bacterium]MBT5319654.1 transglutaminase domain-containing protein [Chloroflexota bacterium]MBT6680592.1 transglutaminase domain-containing protein [Chloroflexota bacterium]